MCVLAVGTSSASPTLTHEEADYYMLALEREQNRRTSSHERSSDATLAPVRARRRVPLPDWILPDGLGVGRDVAQPC
jgi:hypothetical protein